MKEDVMAYDLVFEGGGAKGMVFVGALKALEERDLEYGRLMGTSAGSIMATFLAAGYRADEMYRALAEERDGKPVFELFLETPQPFQPDEIKGSATRKLLRRITSRLLPNFLEERFDERLTELLLTRPNLRPLFNFIERGGIHGTETFLAWLRQKLDEGTYGNEPRRFSHLTLQGLYERTGVHLTLIAANITTNRLLVLNHLTAPGCPVVYAIRMSMSVPFLWEEVIWQDAWGHYRGQSITGHQVVDGGILSNFPIELFVVNESYITAVMGERSADEPEVIGFLIDELLPVPNAPPPPPPGRLSVLGELKTFQRLMQLVDTVTQAHDKMIVEGIQDAVVALPAATYGTIEFAMTPERREALIKAGYEATSAYLKLTYPPGDILGGGVFFSKDTMQAADRIARRMLA
jgi:NTE family protein